MTLFRTWQFWIMTGLAVTLVTGWAFAVYNFSISQENAASVVTLVRSNGELEDRLGAITRQRDDLQASQSSVEDAAKRREDAAKRLEDAAKQHEDKLNKREDDLKKREDAVTEQERVQARNTIAEGNWAVGVDIQPGTYRTKDTVSGSCYWEINSDANGDDIVANDIVSGGRPTVTLKPGQFFTTNRCGDWIRV